MARRTRDTRRLGHHGKALPSSPGRASEGGGKVASDLNLTGVLARLMNDLEHFEAAMTMERGRIEHPMHFGQPGRHSERISSSVTALVAELQQILTLLRRLRESEQLYGHTPSASRARRQPSGERRRRRGPT
jgi:hypothetical protein